MILITHFTSQIIPLSIGFGVSYWVFITADKLDNRLRSIGMNLGWTLLTLTLISLLFSFFYSINLTNKDYMRDNCPIIKINQQQRPLAEPGANYNNSGNTQNANDEENDGIDEELQETYTPGEGEPVKRTKEDH